MPCTFISCLNWRRRTLCWKGCMRQRSVRTTANSDQPLHTSTHGNYGNLHEASWDQCSPHSSREWERGQELALAEELWTSYVFWLGEETVFFKGTSYQVVYSSGWTHIQRYMESRNWSLWATKLKKKKKKKTQVCVRDEGRFERGQEEELG